MPRCERRDTEFRDGLGVNASAVAAVRRASNPLCVTYQALPRNVISMRRQSIAEQMFQRSASLVLPVPPDLR
jgi:hypothetical protein